MDNSAIDSLRGLAVPSALFGKKQSAISGGAALGGARSIGSETAPEREQLLESGGGRAGGARSIGSETAPEREQLLESSWPLPKAKPERTKRPSPPRRK